MRTPNLRRWQWPNSLRSVVLLSTVLVLGHVGTQAQIPIEDGSRVLFIGNSYTGYHCTLPEYVRLACAAATPSIDIHTESVLLYANELSAIFTNTNAVERIREGTWDLVVLQGYNDPIIDHAAYAQAVTSFNEEISAAGALTVLFMVWEMRMHENRWAINSIRSVTDSLAAALNIAVVPVGQLWMTIKYVPPRSLIPDPLAFLYQDDVHPTPMSAGMNAWVFYTIFTGQSPDGVDFTCEAFTPSAELADELQSRTWSVCQPYLWTGTSTASMPARRVKSVRSPSGFDGQTKHLNLLGASVAGGAASDGAAGVYVKGNGDNPVRKARF
jgi:hypothetical protein